jgi:purine-binding chemotaxis protein CheW
MENNLVDNSDHEYLVAEKDKYLAFELNNMPYAVPISLVKEIMEFITVDPIPMAPDFIIGAINLRGEVIPVFDLSIRLAKDKQPCTNRTCIIIVECEFKNIPIVIGFKVDMVTKVLDISMDEIDTVPSIGGQFQSRFVMGLAKLDTNLLTILDISKLLTINEFELIQDISQSNNQLDLELEHQDSSERHYE